MSRFQQAISRTSAHQHRKIRLVRDQRYADNGKLVTAAGLTAGMEGALHVIAKLFGAGYAQGVALGEEYAWTPEGGFVRAALVDQEIPELNIDQSGDWHAQRLEGDTRRWEVAIKGKPKGSAAEFESQVEQALAKGKWTRVGPVAGGASELKFTGRDGKPWKGTVKMGAPDAAGQMTAEIQVARVGSEGGRIARSHGDAP
jgi:hypothetical protein